VTENEVRELANVCLPW